MTRLVLTLLPVLLAVGAGPADLDAAREEVRTLDRERAALLAERDRLEARLDALGDEITARKATPGLLPDGPLSTRLQAAQALSVEVDGLTRRLATVTKRLQAAARGLLAAYDRALARARAVVDPRSDDATLEEALGRVARLELERRQIQADLAGLAPVPGGSPTTEAAPPPEEAAARRALADRLRDEADRLERRLAEVIRSREAQEAQAALEADMRGFLAERSLFDEEATSLPRISTGPADTRGDAAPEYAPGPGAPSPRDDGAFRLDRVPEPEALDELLEARDAAPGETVPELKAREARLETRIRQLRTRADRLEAGS